MTFSSIYIVYFDHIHPLLSLVLPQDPTDPLSFPKLHPCNFFSEWFSLEHGWRLFYRSINTLPQIRQKNNASLSPPIISCVYDLLLVAVLPKFYSDIVIFCSKILPTLNSSLIATLQGTNLTAQGHNQIIFVYLFWDFWDRRFTMSAG